jgi:hypothetical protein
MTITIHIPITIIFIIVTIIIIIIMMIITIIINTIIISPLRSTHVGLTHMLSASCLICGEWRVAEKKHTCSLF